MFGGAGRSRHQLRLAGRRAVVRRIAQRDLRRSGVDREAERGRFTNGVTKQAFLAGNRPVASIGQRRAGFARGPAAVDAGGRRLGNFRLRFVEDMDDHFACFIACSGE